MKLAVFLGGPLHGLTKWVESLKAEFTPRELANIERTEQSYKFAFGDDYIGVYYQLNDFQTKAVAQQVVQLRARHGEDQPALAT